MASEGAAVLVTDIENEVGTHVAEQIKKSGGQAAYAHLDVTSEADWEAAVALAVSDFDGLAILVNNAGTGDLAAIEDISLADWARTIGVDQTGVFLMARSMRAAIAASWCIWALVSGSITRRRTSATCLGCRLLHLNQALLGERRQGGAAVARIGRAPDPPAFFQLADHVRRSGEVAPAYLASMLIRIVRSGAVESADSTM